MASNDLRMRGETWCPGLSSLISMGRFRARTGASRISGDIRLRFGSGADQTCFQLFSRFGGLFLGFNGFSHGIKSAEPADEDRGRGHAESTERGGE